MSKLAAWLAAGLLALMVGASAAPALAAPRMPGFKTLDGAMVAPERMAGKTTVVAIFSSTCPFCRNEAPKLQKLYRDNRQVLNVVAVSIDVDDPAQAANAAAWVRKYGLTHPVTLDFRAFQAVLGKPKGVPALYVFDRHGKLARTEVGEMLDEDFDDIARDARTAAAAAIAPVPPAADLQGDSRLAAGAAMPLVLFFSLPNCRYCHAVRHNYLAPLLRGPDSAREGYVIREVEVGSSRAATGLDGLATTHAALAQRYSVSFAPTVLFVGADGEMLAPPLKGGDTAGMYGAYLEARFATARQAAKANTAASASAPTVPSKERPAP